MSISIDNLSMCGAAQKISGAVFQFCCAYLAQKVLIFAIDPPKVKDSNP
jgi:hypothetical protein